MRRRRLGATGKQARWQQSIALNIQIGQQIELLEHDAHVFSTQAVALYRTECGHVETEDFTDPTLRWLYTCKQGQQGTFATTAGALNKQMLALRHRQTGDVKQRRAIGPCV